MVRAFFPLGSCGRTHYLFLMNTRFPTDRVIGAALALAIAAATVPVHAAEIGRSPVITLSPGELQNLNNRERRLDYQQLQQIYRELDSQAIRRQQQRPEVPVMKPRCPLPTSGAAQTCR